MSETIGVSSLLGIAFVILKLCGVIDWSWWWVTLPFWGGIAILVLFLIGFLIYVLCGGKVKEKPGKPTFKERLAEMAERRKSK